MDQVVLYDTTLRDGMQREGLSLTVGEQVAIALRLAEMGIHYLGPASRPPTRRSASSSRRSRGRTSARRAWRRSG